MARVSCKINLLLVAFLLLCFFSIPTRARNLRAVSSKEAEKEVEQRNVVTDQKEVDGPSNDDGLLDMDYTPARRKPPIHN